MFTYWLRNQCKYHHSDTLQMQNKSTILFIKKQVQREKIQKVHRHSSIFSLGVKPSWILIRTISGIVSAEIYLVRKSGWNYKSAFLAVEVYLDYFGFGWSKWRQECGPPEWIYRYMYIMLLLPVIWSVQRLMQTCWSHRMGFSVPLLPVSGQKSDQMPYSHMFAGYCDWNGK